MIMREHVSDQRVGSTERGQARLKQMREHVSDQRAAELDQQREARLQQMREYVTTGQMRGQAAAGEQLAA